MKTPSKAQKQAIIHLKGPALICAGPGSGKTFTIIQRILYLINQYHVRPDKILVITYTKAAANEMKARFEAASSYEGVRFGTFHSICFNILKQSGSAFSNSLITEADKRKLFQTILGNQGLTSKAGYDSVTVLQNAISRIKNMFTGNQESIALTEEYYANTEFSVDEIMAVKEEYDCFLREQGMLDFDDMVTECLKLLIENPVICNKYQQMFEYILTDEFQDVNQSQYQILKLLSAPENNLFAVGDDDQAIYGFRGASPDIMQKFILDFPDRKQIMLTENYRCGKGIVKLAEKMIARNRNRFVKEFSAVNSGGNLYFSCFDTRMEEEKQLIKELSSLEKDALCHTAIILRTNREVVQYALLLQEAEIAVKRKNLPEEDIFHSFIMEDIEAFLSYLYNGKKRCDFIRFMNKPNRFFARAALPFEKVAPGHMEQYYLKNPEMLSVVKKFFVQVGIAEKLTPALAVTFFRKNLGYDSYLHQKAKDQAELKKYIRWADRILQCFEKYKTGMSLQEFIEKQAQEAKAKVSETTEKQGVSVITMHGSKGLEFERVYLPDVNEGIIPGRSIKTETAHEEERRLLYVAITRAQKDLYIYYTKERSRKLSRYLEGLIPHQ